jgi:phage anti-repressor protein
MKIRPFRLVILAVAAAALVAAPRHAGAEDEDPVLFTLGATLGQGLFLTHMAMGTLVDAYSKNAYEQKQALEIVVSYQNITRSTRQMVADMLKAKKFDKCDAEFLQRVVGAYDLLLSCAQHVENLIRSGEDKHARSYFASRDKAWKEIADLLGIKE